MSLLVDSARIAQEVKVLEEYVQIHQTEVDRARGRILTLKAVLEGAYAPRVPTPDLVSAFQAAGGTDPGITEALSKIETTMTSEQTHALLEKRERRAKLRAAAIEAEMAARQEAAMREAAQIPAPRARSVNEAEAAKASIESRLNKALTRQAKRGTKKT